MTLDSSLDLNSDCLFPSYILEGKNTFWENGSDDRNIVIQVSGKSTWCLVKFCMILTARKMLLWCVTVEKKTFGLWKWKYFPCFRGVLWQTLSQLERIYPECERLWWTICLFAPWAVPIGGAVSMVPGIAQEHSILDRLFKKSMVVKELGSKN